MLLQGRKKRSIFRDRHNLIIVEQEKQYSQKAQIINDNRTLKLSHGFTCLSLCTSCPVFIGD